MVWLPKFNGRKAIVLSGAQLSYNYSEYIHIPSDFVSVITIQTGSCRSIFVIFCSDLFFVGSNGSYNCNDC